MSIQREFEISNDRLIVDPRTFLKKIWDAFQIPHIPFVWAVLSGIITLVWSGFIPFALIVFLILRLAVVIKPDTLPIHLPLEAKKLDLNDAKIGDGTGFNMARGSFYLGRIRKLKSEVWVNFKALTQHFLVFGTTGAGKTESLVSYIVNFLSVGSGAAFQDAKAAPKAMIQIATICRIFGRDDDFRVTNYITGLTSERRDPASRQSNDSAVFARGSAESNTQLLVSLMPASEGENKIFAERAVALVSAVFPALTDLRDMGVLQIDPGVIRNHMSFPVFAGLFRDNRITKRSRDALKGYLESLPGYVETKDVADQPEEVTRQFGFAQAYFTRSLASLSDTYGYIYMVGQGEIDYQDAVLNGRILLTLLPSMEKSGEELANLGKIVLTAIKNGMVVGLGTVFEGSAEDIVHSLPTNSEIPYGVINDENAYMLVEGQEIINAQARGLGFGVFTGTQDAPGMLENISKTTKQILANSAFKQIMYIDDKETTELATSFSGEAHVLVRNRYERGGDLGNVYASKDVNLEKQTRITATDIKKQGTGQAFVLYQGSVHEMQVFNHGIAEKSKDPTRRFLDHWFPVRMAKVRIPSEDTIKRYIQHFPRQEWEDLYAITRDDARQMVSEMTTYFASQAVIRNVAKFYDSLDVVGSEDARRALVADNILNYSPPPASGLVEKIVEHSPRTLSDIVECVAAIVSSNATNHVRIQAEADMANLDSFEDMPLAPFDDIDDAASGGTGEASSNGSGGGQRPAAEDDFDPLAAYMGDYVEPPFDGDTIPPADAAPEEASLSAPHELPTQVAEPLPEPSSAMGRAVSANLAMMPWMASEIDYNQVHRSIVSTEMLFNGENEPAAIDAANDVIEKIIETLEYPKTQIPSSTDKQQRVRDLFSDWLD